MMVYQLSDIHILLTMSFLIYAVCEEKPTCTLNNGSEYCMCKPGYTLNGNCCGM